jgi:hypothetical protein
VQFALLVKSHANARYTQSLLKLAALECECLLFALQIKAEVKIDHLAGTPFLCVETDALGEDAWAYLARHSAVMFAAVRDGEWLRPLERKWKPYLESDLSQLLKYKGKTNADFTAMMLHCARSASAFALTRMPLTVLDPLCGRGTSLFCALEEGDCAIGLDMDDSALNEADVYMTRYLQYHRYKHRRTESSITLRAGGALRECRFTLSNDTDSYKRGDTRTLSLVRGDTANAWEAVGENGCHLIIADLPYGVQHAPREGKAAGTLEGLVHKALPAYHRALKPGGAMALAFNTFTLSKDVIIAEMEKAGLIPLTQPPFHDFAHWVEQAVNRDMVIAVKPER